MTTAEELSRFPDTFNGDDAHLVRCIEALLSLDATGTLVPHGIGGHARGLLSAAMHRLVIQSRAAGVQGADELLRSENPDRKDFTVDEALRIADQNDAAYKHVPSVSRTLAAEVRRLATPQPPKDAGAVPLPEPDVDGTVRHPKMKICYTAPVHYTRERLIEYGDARAAAAVARHGGEAPACNCDGAAYEPNQTHPFLVNRACPRHGEAQPTPPGAVDEAMRKALTMFRGAKEWVASDSWDGIDKRGRELMEEADQAASAALTAAGMGQAVDTGIPVSGKPPDDSAYRRAIMQLRAEGKDEAFLTTVEGLAQSLGAQPAAAGYVIADGQGKRWRFWGDSGPEWTTDRDTALRFARREDAEAVAHDDEDAWLIQKVGPVPAVPAAAGVPEGWRAALEEALSVVSSVAMGKDRVVVREGENLYLQTEEWCKWLGDEVKPMIEKALAAAPQPSNANHFHFGNGSAEGAVIAMSRMKDAAMEAHRLCYQAMLAHPDVATLGDDGELHKAIHAIVGVDTNAYEARSPEPAGRDAVAYTDPENLADGSDPNSWELYRPGDQAKGDVALYASAPALDSEELVNLIRNDAYAITFQSMGQYRSALLRRLAGAPNHGQ